MSSSTDQLCDVGASIGNRAEGGLASVHWLSRCVELPPSFRSSAHRSMHTCPSVVRPLKRAVRPWLRTSRHPPVLPHDKGRPHSTLVHRIAIEARRFKLYTYRKGSKVMSPSVQCETY